MFVYIQKTRAIWKRLLLGICVTGFAFSSPLTLADPVSTSSRVSINSVNSVQDGTENDSVENTTGELIEVGSSGSQVFAYANGSGGFTFKPTTDETFAQSSLGTGELRVRSYFEFGTNTNTVPMPVGERSGSASATASFGDSFRAYSDDAPFPWTSGTPAQFSFWVTGDSSIPGGLVDPVNDDPGQPLNRVNTRLDFSIFEPGGLDILKQIRAFDFDSYPDFDTGLAAFLALSDQLAAMTIARDYWYLGDFIMPFDEDPAKILAVDPVNPTNIIVDFIPDGDFDWFMELDTSLVLDASLQNVAVLTDFSNTVLASYTAPAGSTTYSASGLFPGTLDLSTAPVAMTPDERIMNIQDGITAILLDSDMSLSPRAVKNLEKGKNRLDKALLELAAGNTVKVLARSRDAVRRLLKAEKEGAETGALIDELVTLAAELANEAVAAALPVWQLSRNPTREIERAEKNFAKAASELLIGRPDKAINIYRNILARAVRAIS